MHRLIERDDAMQIRETYPTKVHQEASEVVVDFFSRYPVEAVILFGSCAHGGAAPDSCLDIMVLISPETFSIKPSLESQWNAFYSTERIFKELRKFGPYSHVDMDFTDGQFVPKLRGWISRPDEFELEIGNTLVYSVPLYKKGEYFDNLKSQWLPYYGEELRLKRLEEVLMYCRNNLDHILSFVNRHLYFQAFNRLYDAYFEFLQALFISRKTYPIAYDKWIKVQMEEVLSFPELYPHLVDLLQISSFESLEIARKAEKLTHLVEKYVVDHQDEST